MITERTFDPDPLPEYQTLKVAKIDAVSLTEKNEAVLWTTSETGFKVQTIVSLSDLEAAIRIIYQYNVPHLAAFLTTSRELQ